MRRTNLAERVKAQSSKSLPRCPARIIAVTLCIALALLVPKNSNAASAWRVSVQPFQQESEQEKERKREQEQREQQEREQQAREQQAREQQEREQQAEQEREGRARAQQEQEQQVEQQQREQQQAEQQQRNQEQQAEQQRAQQQRYQEQQAEQQRAQQQRFQEQQAAQQRAEQERLERARQVTPQQEPAQRPPALTRSETLSSVPRSSRSSPVGDSNSRTTSGIPAKPSSANPPPTSYGSAGSSGVIGQPTIPKSGVVKASPIRSATPPSTGATESTNPPVANPSANTSPAVTTGSSTNANQLLQAQIFQSIVANEAATSDQIQQASDDVLVAIAQNTSNPALAQALLQEVGRPDPIAAALNQQLQSLAATSTARVHIQFYSGDPPGFRQYWFGLAISRHNDGAVPGDGSWGAYVSADPIQQVALNTSEMECENKTSMPNSCGTAGLWPVCRPGGGPRWVALAIYDDGVSVTNDGEGIGALSESDAERGALSTCSGVCSVVWTKEVDCGSGAVGTGGSTTPGQTGTRPGQAPQLSPAAPTGTPLTDPCNPTVTAPARGNGSTAGRLC